MVKARASGDMMPRAAGSVSTLYWWYQCTLQPYLAKALALSMAMLSAAIVWSESTLRFDWIDISPLAAVRCSLMAHVDCWRRLSLFTPSNATRDVCMQIVHRNSQSAAAVQLLVTGVEAKPVKVPLPRLCFQPPAPD